MDEGIPISKGGDLKSLWSKRKKSWSKDLGIPLLPHPNKGFTFLSKMSCAKQEKKNYEIITF